MKLHPRILTCVILLNSLLCFAQDQFSLNPELAGQHPRILFTAEEAASRALLVRNSMPADWSKFMSDCNNIGYPAGSVMNQQIWWYFSRLGTGIAMTGEQGLIDKGKTWLATAYESGWDITESTASLDDAHKLAGFAFLYDCMYPHLNDDLRGRYEALLADQLVLFRTKGYDQNDYWTNDYQNNHMHFRAAASLYCSIILADKLPSLQSEFDHVMTVWRRMAHMAPPDGSNHEGLNYSNYGGQMLFPAIAALKHCTEMDLSLEEHYRNIGYYYLYHVTPGYGSGFGFGDAANSAAASGPNYLFQIAAETGDPHINHLAHKLREEHASSFYLSQWPVIYTDPMLDRCVPDRLPLHRYFEDLGILITRSSWEPDATAVAFKCGPMGGHLLNETRGTEYSHYTDYINVAHDDPDAGTFLLFSKGSFLTTGDGYEKTAKVSQSHSTFIVDDECQAGGGTGWSQPSPLNKLAWQKDVFAVNNRVVFTGDMTGVYSDMQKLERTFVSHKAGYILIYDQAKSGSAGRSFEWRLQTTGSLNAASDRTYDVVNGNANALAHIVFPGGIAWETTTSPATAIDGKILRTRLEGQQENDFLVMLLPNGSNLDALAESYENPEYKGVRISLDGRNEYTFFKNEAEKQSTLGHFSFNASTFLLVEQEAGQVLESAVLVNGDSLSYGDQFSMYADMPLDFGLESMEADGSGLRIRLAPSSGSTEGQTTHLTLGSLSPNTHYSLYPDQGTPIEMDTDAEGRGSVDLELSGEISIYMSSLAVNPQVLEQLVADAQWRYDQSVEGSGAGEYLPAQRAAFLEAINDAQDVLGSYTGQGEVDQALSDLQSAMDDFVAAATPDLGLLQSLLDEAYDLLDAAVEGEEEGMYEAGSKATFLQMILMAEDVAEDALTTQVQADGAVQDLMEAISTFQDAVIPWQPLMVFSDISWYGDIQNYFLNSESIWEVIEADDEVIVGMKEYSDQVGQYMLVKDSVFNGFDLRFEARSVIEEYPSDLMIVLGYKDDSDYSYVKLSSLLNKSGAFTRAGTGSSFSWLLSDYETYGVSGENWSAYRLISEDSVLTVYRDEQELFTLEPQSGLNYTGQVGVGTYYMNRAYFDNISLTRLGSISGRRDQAVEGLRCYPNPVDHILVLEAPEPLRSIRLFDCTGKVVMQASFASGSTRHRLNMEPLPAGMYFLHYVNEKGYSGYERILKN